MAEEIIHVPDTDVTLLSLAESPQRSIEQASQAASAIMGVIEGKPKIVSFNGQIYFENEDWVFIGKYYGVTVRIVKDNYVEFGTVKGFEAEAEAVLTSTGQVIGRAFMMCLDDEENWGAVPKYEWQDVLDSEGRKIWEEKIIKGKKKNLPKSVKVKVGEVKKPLFQLRSMAQTRASSKVLSMIFKFIPVLASKGGKRVSGTPAEEASEDFNNTGLEPEHSDRPTRAKRKTEVSTEPEKPRDPDCITQEQVTYLYTIASKCKLSHQDVIDELKANFKDKSGNPVDSTRKILIKDYQNVLNAIDPNFHHHAPAPPADAQEETGANG